MSADKRLLAGRFVTEPPENSGPGVAVRRAADLNTGRPCRVYEIPAGLPEVDYKLLETAAPELLKLRHPSLESLLAVVKEGKGAGAVQYWVYEAAAGKTFSELAAEGRPFQENAAVGMAAALAGALKAAHASPYGRPLGGVSPEAVRLGPGGRPVLEGVRPFEPGPAARDYAPPGEPPSAAADIYGLGATLAFLFTRRTPEMFRAAGGYAGLANHTGFSADFCRVLEKMTAGSPGGRYSSAGALEKELGVLLGGARPSAAAGALRALGLAAALALGAGGALSLLTGAGTEAELKGGGVEWSLPGGLAFSPDGKWLALAGDEQLRLWDTASWKRVKAPGLENGRGRKTRSVHFFHDGGLAVGSDTGHGVSALRFIRSGGAVVRWTAQLRTRLDSAALSPDGALYAVAENVYDRNEQRSRDGSITVYGADGSVRYTLPTLGNPVFALNFSHDGKTLVYRTYHWDPQAKVHNLGRVVRRSLAGGAEEVLASDPKPGYVSGLFSCGQFGLVVLPEPGSEALNVYGPGGVLRARLNGDSLNGEYVYNTSAEGAFSPDGKYFAAHVTLKNRLWLRVFDTRSWKEVKAYKMGKWAEGGVAAITFSPDGRMLAAAQGNAYRSKVRIYSLKELYGEGQ